MYFHHVIDGNLQKVAQAKQLHVNCLHYFKNLFKRWSGSLCIIKTQYDVSNNASGSHLESPYATHSFE